MDQVITPACKIYALVLVAGTGLYQSSSAVAKVYAVPEAIIQGSALTILAFVVYRLFMVELPGFRQTIDTTVSKYLEHIEGQRKDYLQALHAQEMQSKGYKGYQSHFDERLDRIESHISG